MTGFQERFGVMLLQKPVCDIFKAVSVNVRHKIIVQTQLVHVILRTIWHEALKQVAAFVVQIIVSPDTIISDSPSAFRGIFVTCVDVYICTENHIDIHFRPRSPVKQDFQCLHSGYPQSHKIGIISGSDPVFMQMLCKVVMVRGFIMRTQPVCKPHHLLQLSVYSIVLRLGFAWICRIGDPDQWVFDCCLKSCCHSSSLRYKRIYALVADS